MGLEGLDDAGGQGRWEGRGHGRGEVRLFQGDEKAKLVESGVEEDECFYR